MVSEKFASKNLNFTENVRLINFFCHTAISQFLMADISFNIACKELKIAQIAQLNQLVQFLHLVDIYGHDFYELSRMLMRTNVNNDVSQDSPITCTTYCFQGKGHCFVTIPIVFPANHKPCLE